MTYDSGWRLERADLLTPLDSWHAGELMRSSGVHDHYGEFIDGVDYLVTPITLPVRDVPSEERREPRALLGGPHG